ncbi:MAG: hypothetical protein QNK20_14460 [Aureibaculum sp.]|nr:hypothetical protein [Aureibaculum sp.]
MPTNIELKEECALLKQQLSVINSQITEIIKTKNKKYLYSNTETTHSAETQDLKSLQDLRKDIKEQITSIEYQLTGIFVQFKNS